MVRVLDVDTQTAIRDPGKIIIRNTVLVDAIDPGGDVVRFGFTDFGEDITVNIIDGRTQTEVSRTFYGDSGPLISIDPVPLQMNIDIPTVQVILSQIHSQAQAMVRSNNIRNVQAQIHRMYLDPESMQPVAPPRCRFLGIVNGAPIETPAYNGGGSITLRITSHTRELTRTNPAKRSHETQKLRTDNFRRYSTVAGDWEIFWGEKSAKTTSDSGSSSNKK